MTALLRLLSVLSCGVALVVSFGTGPPSSACRRMRPDGHNAETFNANQNGAPYEFIVPKTVFAGEPANLVVRGSKPFKGFMVRVIHSKNGEGAGQFSASYQDNYKSMTCHKSDDTASHSDPSPKSIVNLKWTAPSQPGIYFALATIVEDYSTTYVGHKGVIQVKSREGGSQHSSPVSSSGNRHPGTANDLAFFRRNPVTTSRDAYFRQSLSPYARPVRSHFAPQGQTIRNAPFAGGISPFAGGSEFTGGSQFRGGSQFGDSSPFAGGRPLARQAPVNRFVRTPARNPFIGNQGTRFF